MLAMGDTRKRHPREALLSYPPENTPAWWLSGREQVAPPCEVCPSVCDRGDGQAHEGDDEGAETCGHRALDGVPHHKTVARVALEVRHLGDVRGRRVATMAWYGQGRRHARGWPDPPRAHAISGSCCVRPGAALGVLLRAQARSLHPAPHLAPLSMRNSASCSASRSALRSASHSASRSTLCHYPDLPIHPLYPKTPFGNIGPRQKEQLHLPSVRRGWPQQVPERLPPTLHPARTSRRASCNLLDNTALENYRQGRVFLALRAHAHAQARGFCPHLADLDKMLTSIDQRCVKLSQLRPTLADVGQNVLYIGQVFANCHKSPLAVMFEQLFNDVATPTLCGVQIGASVFFRPLLFGPQAARAELPQGMHKTQDKNLCVWSCDRSRTVLDRGWWPLFDRTGGNFGGVRVVSTELGPPPTKSLARFRPNLSHFTHTVAGGVFDQGWGAFGQFRCGFVDVWVASAKFEVVWAKLGPVSACASSAVRRINCGTGQPKRRWAVQLA